MSLLCLSSFVSGGRGAGRTRPPGTGLLGSRPSTSVGSRLTAGHRAPASTAALKAAYMESDERLLHTIKQNTRTVHTTQNTAHTDTPQIPSTGTFQKLALLANLGFDQRVLQEGYHTFGPDWLTNLPKIM